MELFFKNAASGAAKLVKLCIQSLTFLVESIAFSIAIENSKPSPSCESRFR